MTIDDLTHVQAAVLEALTVGDSPRLVHHTMACEAEIRGRGQVRWSRHRMEGQLIPAYLVRKLVKSGYVELNPEHGKGQFEVHYIITESGRQAVAEAQKGSRSTATGQHPKGKK